MNKQLKIAVGLYTSAGVKEENQDSVRYGKAEKGRKKGKVANLGQNKSTYISTCYALLKINLSY